MNALNSRKHRKLILLNVLVALALVTFLISILGDGFDLHNANGQTANLMAGNVGVEYNNRVFDITDVSIKYDDVWGPTMIGLIQNKDQNSKIEGVTLSVQMYDRNNHLIGVMKGYPQSGDIQPNQKTAFEIQSGDEEIRNIDHVFIEIQRLIGELHIYPIAKRKCICCRKLFNKSSILGNHCCCSYRRYVETTWIESDKRISINQYHKRECG